MTSRNYSSYELFRARCLMTFVLATQLRAKIIKLVPIPEPTHVVSKKTRQSTINSNFIFDSNLFLPHLELKNACS